MHRERGRRVVVDRREIEHLGARRGRGHRADRDVPAAVPLAGGDHLPAGRDELDVDAEPLGDLAPDIDVEALELAGAVEGRLGRVLGVGRHHHDARAKSPDRASRRHRPSSPCSTARALQARMARLFPREPIAVLPLPLRAPSMPPIVALRQGKARGRSPRPVTRGWCDLSSSAPDRYACASRLDPNRGRK